MIVFDVFQIFRVKSAVADEFRNEPDCSKKIKIRDVHLVPPRLPGFENPRTRWTSTISHADIFVPQLRPCPDELAHQADAGGIVHNNQVDTARAHIIFRAAKGFVFPNDNPGDLVEQSGSAAHVAG